MANLSVSFRYTKEDIFNFVVETLALEKLRCFMILVSIIMLLIAGATMLYLKAVLSAIIAIASAILFVPMVIFLMYQTVAASLQGLTDCTYILDDDKLITTSNFGTNSLDLKSFDRIVISKPAIFIFLSKKKAFFIPVRAFSTPEKATEYIEALQERFQAAKNA